MDESLKTIYLSLLLTISVASNSLARPLDIQQSTHINEISAELLTTRLSNEGLSNKMVSGISLFYALSVLESGAAGSSEALLNRYLLRTEDVELTSVTPALIEQLTSAPGGHEGMGTFEASNTVWSTNGETNKQPFAFNPLFQQTVQDCYKAPAMELDFMALGASDVINEWANAVTHGLIPEVIDDSVLKKLEWLIASAAYFQGAWARPMQRVESDANYRFKRLDGTTVAAPTITTRNDYDRVLDREDGSVAFQLPFLGGKYSFIALVPSESEASLEKWLTESAPLDLPMVVSDVLENKGDAFELFVQIPVFSFSDEVTLTQKSQTTRDLNLGLLFSDQADFEPMIDRARSLPTDKETKVGIIKQDTRIELDEGGVKAAAVTLIGGVIKSTIAGPRLTRRDMIVDRPFAFAIVENSSQTILFSGILVEPEQV
jgi:serpin B